MSIKPAESFSVVLSERRQDMFIHSLWVSSFHSRTLLLVIPALSLVVSLLKSVCRDFSIFSAVMPQSPALCLTWYGILSYTHHLLSSGTQLHPRYRNVSTCSSCSYWLSVQHVIPWSCRRWWVGSICRWLGLQAIYQLLYFCLQSHQHSEGL